MSQHQSVTDRLATVVSGAMSGGIVSVTVQPLDVIRTRMQGDGAKGLVRGPISTVRQIFRESGVIGFWRGTGPTLVRMTFGVGLHFLTIELLKTTFNSATRNNEWGKDALIGGLSRGVVTVAMCPITVIKTRMEYINRPYRSTLHAAMTIASKEELCFRGFVPTLVASAPFSALHYMFYRRMQTLVYKDSDERTWSKNLLCSTVAAASATLITQPADVVRTRVQLGYGAGGALSSVATLRDVLVSQGLHGITLGVVPRMLKRTLQTALVWAMYEEILPKLRETLKTTS